MYSIKKRNGEAEVFELGKIKSAIARTFESCNRNYQDSIVEIIALKAVSSAETKVVDGLLSVEDIQDAVEKTLMTLGYEDVAKAYILYRKQHEKARNAQNTLLDYKNVVESYTKKLDWRVKENATVTYSVGGLILGNSGAVTANYWLSEIYDEEIANAHRNCDLHIHDLSMLSPYCGGWSLKQLIKEGLGGIEGKITSTPASHLSTLCNQMVNFLGCTQNEYAGAQAFSSVDTYLAPFVKVDNLTYKEVKQCIQSLVFGLNTPSRWGCVTTDTEVLTVNGFKKYNELKEGDLVYTYKDGSLEINPVNHIVVKPFSGKLHSYQSRNYAQTVTPEHRVLVYKHNSNECIIKHSEEIFTVKTPFALPVTFASSELTDNGLSDEEVMLAAMVYTDGSFDFRGDTIHKVSIYKSPKRYGSKELVDILTKLNLEYTVSMGHGNFGEVNKYVLYGDSARFICDLCGNKKEISSKFMNMSKRQAELFLKTWASFDGDEDKMLCQYDNDTIRDNLQQIAILAGKCSYWHTAKLYSGKTTNYVKIRKVDSIYPTDRVEIDYSGDVWCPSVENGTVVFRDNSGCVFISGNCQAPFTNFTMDWTVPDDLAELNCIVGGKELDFCYKDCKREMDMINKAIIDVMLEGDANGRGFQYPVLTYSITKDFDWDEESINNQMLFEMTAKYGIPYFSNYINSDMSPSDLRAMCPVTPDTLVVVRSKQNGIRVCQIKDVYNGYNIKGTLYDVWTGKDWCAGRPVKVDKTDVYEIVFSNGYSVRMGENHLQPTRDNGTLKASELKEGMWLPFNKHSYGTDLGSYELGYAVGAYAGDGSHDSSAIVYSLCKFEKDDETEQILTKFWKSVGFDVKTTYSDNNVRFVRVNGNPYDIVSRYVFGENALDKGLTNKTFSASDEFKRGFIAGLRATDGSREKRRISTSSKTMTEHLNILFSSLGLKCTMGSADTRDGRYSVNPNYTVAFPERERYGDIFDEDDQYIYYKIKTITKCNYSGDYLYCFEVDNDDHLFALANGLITHNCRLRLDLRELRKKSGGYFGSGDSTGSIGVVTINMPRLAYTSKDESEFYTKLDKLMDIAARSLEIKRSVISQFLDNGLYPYTKRYLGSFNNYFSTIGLVGMNEACLNAVWIKDTIASEAGYRFSCSVLDHMRERLADYQEKYGNLYNLEATPAESTSHRFARHDVEAYPDIITAGTKTGGTPYYTNSSHLPVDFTEDIFTALDIQDGLQTKYTSGTVFHAFLGEKLPSWQSAMKLTRTIAENYRLPYFTFSPTYSVCKNHGYIAGEHFTCPECGEATEVYSRVTGYYRAVQNFNDGKAQEYKDRTEYVINSIPEKFNTEDTPDESPYPTASVKKITLFATTTCPNCAQAKKQLTAAGIDYDVVIADGTDPVGTQLAIECGVKQAPTLVLPTGEVISNVSNIIRYIRENK